MKYTEKKQAIFTMEPKEFDEAIKDYLIKKEINLDGAEVKITYTSNERNIKGLIEATITVNR